MFTKFLKELCVFKKNYQSRSQMLENFFTISPQHSVQFCGNIIFAEIHLKVEICHVCFSNAKLIGLNFGTKLKSVCHAKFWKWI